MGSKAKSIHFQTEIKKKQYRSFTMDSSLYIDPPIISKHLFYSGHYAQSCRVVEIYFITFQVFLLFSLWYVTGYE